MKKKAIIIGVSFFVVVLAILLFTAPFFWGTCKVYFDLNNGLAKKQWDSLGFVYWESIEETDYSKLLKKFELNEETSNWKLADSEELGGRRFFFPQNVSYSYGKIAAMAKMFSIWIAMCTEYEKLPTQEAREKVLYFSELVKKSGDSSEAKDYIIHHFNKGFNEAFKTNTESLEAKKEVSSQ
ncbi:MAG: hypothetical protein J6W90_04400 [Verrucomicrobia bacterium]|nr:hypothetical protein [Verrucomicrobiota bacterium]MBP5760598.1 hypothetical protein [Verrucomicrobiota bacterium]